MDPDRARIEDDLKGLLEGQVRCDETFLHLYASDASLYEIKPIGVVRPLHTADVVACVNYARENDLTIIPRGAGSNVLGATLGNGLILDFSYSMRQILSVDRESVTVQPGLVLGDLNDHLASHGRMFGPDPSNRNVSTIGGMLSLNTSGSHWQKTGTPRDHVISLQIVLSDGTVIEVESALCQTAGGEPRTANKKSKPYQLRILNLLERHHSLIQKEKPASKVNQAGYNVFDLRNANAIDLTRLFVGSEGTLGIITEAKLRTIPVPRHRGVVALFFHSLDTAARAAVEISKSGVVACDLLDRRLLSLARESNSQNRRLIPVDAEAMLLVEFESADDAGLRDKTEQLVQRVVRKKKWAFNSQTTTQRDVRNAFWRIARRSVPTLYRMQGNRRAIPFVEDIGIPPERLAEFLKEVHAVLNRHELTASVFCHAPQGTVHVRPFLEVASNDQIDKMQKVATDLFEKVLQYDGTVSATRGDGLSRSWFLRRQYGKLNGVFSEIKDLFDPGDIFNSGKVASHRFSALTDNLRHFEINVGPRASADNQPAITSDNADVDFGSTEQLSELPPPSSTSKKNRAKGRTASSAQPLSQPSTALPVITPELNWSLESMAAAAQNCNGCGRCRTGVKIERMCPVFRLAPREEASPRAKANLMRGVLTGQLPAETITKESFKEIADLCVNCHQCRFECPAQVDIPQLMVEAKAQYISVNGMKLSDSLLTRLDWLYGFAGSFPWLVNHMLKTRSTRWLLDRLLGIAQGRKLPTFATGTFLRWAQRAKLNVASKQSSRKVVFFVDVFANWNDVELGIAFCNVLKHNNIDVLVPSRQDVSGMSLISEGVIPRARKIASRNVEMLADWVRQGYQIVTTEPSAALAIKHEYLNLMDDEDAIMVSKNTTDSSSYLLSLHRSGELELDFKPVNATIGYHLPCHQRALIEADCDTEIPGMKLLSLIPGLQVELMQKGCSGMAGTYGLKRKNYNRSLRMGLQLIQAMRSPTIVAGTTECSACKVQMEQGTTKPTIHPIKILALAYGLMPELDDLFDRRSGELTIS